MDDNGATLGRCVYDCNGNEPCETGCLDSFKSRQANCPCEVRTLCRIKGPYFSITYATYDITDILLVDKIFRAF